MLTMDISSAKRWHEDDLRLMLMACHARGIEDARAELAGLCLYKGETEHGVRITVYSRVMLREIVEVWEQIKRTLGVPHGLGCCWVECPAHSGCVYDILESKCNVQSES
jgi:hypothetical protein